MIILATALLFCCLAVNGIESWAEKDWPRDTFKFTFWVLAILLICIT